MRLLQAGKAYDPHLGGIETVMRQVGEGAAAAGWESAVLVANDGRAGINECRNGVDVVRTPTWTRALSLPVSPAYVHALRHERADTLLVHEPTLLAAVSLMADRTSKDRFGRIVVWWHSDIVRQRLLAPAYRPVLEHLLDLADSIVVATPHHLDSSLMLNRYRDKATVIPYGIDPTRYEWSVERIRRVHAVRQRFRGVPLIVYAGRLARYKGMPELAKAMDLLPTGHLVVIGDGACRAAIESSPAFAAGRVTILPHLAAEEFVDMLWAADVFVLPSTQNSEAFGIVQIEAMACATPVVTFDLPTGVTWVNRNNETGLVARLGDVTSLASCIGRLLDDPELRDRLGQHARRRALDTFGDRRMVERTLQVLTPTAHQVVADAVAP